MPPRWDSLESRRRACAPAKGEPGALKVSAEAHVERDVRVVGVHIQPGILSLAILDHEGVMAGERGPRLLHKEQGGHGLQHLLLQAADHFPHPNLIHDDACSGQSVSLITKLRTDFCKCR